MVLAPMEDVTDPAFRMICKEQGAAMVYTEFVSAEALVRDIPSTLKKLRINDAERPVAIQIYGLHHIAGDIQHFGNVTKHPRSCAL